MEKRVWVAGEALVDLMRSGDSEVASVGGGAANTARALVKLGIKTSFIGGISNDDYGLMIASEFADVDLSLSRKVALPTALANHHVAEDGSASYTFGVEGTATFDFSGDWLPALSPEVLHIGSLSTIIEPGASTLFDWAKDLSATIVYDPNVRPSFLADKDEYRQLVERWIGISKIVKLSSEEMSWLGYLDTRRFFDLGAQFVVVTHGAKGMTGLTKYGSVDVPGVKTSVVDSVGAGDTVGAVLVEALVKYGFDELVKSRLFEVLRRAAKAAAITCSRVGANPPTLAELE